MVCEMAAGLLVLSSSWTLYYLPFLHFALGHCDGLDLSSRFSEDKDPWFRRRDLGLGYRVLAAIDKHSADRAASEWRDGDFLRRARASPGPPDRCRTKQLRQLHYE